MQAKSAVAREHFAALQTQFDTKLTEVSGELERSAKDTMTEASNQQTNMLDSLDEQVNTFSSGLTTMGQTASATGESMVVVKDTMTTAMDTTSIGLKSIIGTLMDIKEILEKIS